MQMYSFKKGRDVLLLTEDGATQRYELKRDVATFSDNILVDPIRLHNAALQKNASDYLGLKQIPMDLEALNLAQQGYTVFEMPGRRTNARYAFAVIVGENDSEMD